MASTLVLLLQLLLVSLVSASHHIGRSITFNYHGKNPDGSYRVDVHKRLTFDGCFYQPCSCLKGDCGTVSKRLIGIVDRSTNAPISNSQWCETETIDKRSLTSNKPFYLRSFGCCWTATRNGVYFWTTLTFVDLGIRSDTGKPNRSPDIGILPFLRVPENCPRTYNLISYDPDHDKVRCRYGRIRHIECSACDQPSGFHLDEDSCTLHYHYSPANPRVYGFEMVVEDFPKNHIILSYTDGSRAYRSPLPVSTASPSTTASPFTTSSALTAAEPLNSFPLSKIPLQFSFLIDPPVPSCEEGLYLPKFVYPTPENGAHIQAEVGKVVEIRIKAYVTYGTIENIIISGPLGVSKHRTTHDEFVIRWKPVKDDLWNHFTICFAVESVIGSDSHKTTPDSHSHHHPTPASQSGMYQSELRSVLVDVRNSRVEANVICSESTVRVEVEKSSFAGLRLDRLRLSDPSNTVCSLQTNSNSTHVIAIFPLNACGTQIEEDEQNLIFKNVIAAFDNSQDVITRKNLLEVQFFCQYPKQGNVTLNFIAHRKKVTVWERGMGTFTYEFEFYTDDRFQTMIDPGSFPVVFSVGERIFMQITASSSLNNTELFVESCSAAPYDTPNYKPTYPIIENGCAVDDTLELHSPPHGTTFQFSMEAFKFIGTYNQVYISCSVIVCEAGNSNTRCSKGCMISLWPNDHNHHQHDRRKREAVIQSANHFVSQGPLRLKRSADGITESLNLNLNLVLIAGCLLAAVGMVCGVILYKARMSRVRYQRVPENEN